ncbi:peptidoglycan DD-metalloendopeptidase family protein [Nitratidesulfovibrio sp. HK-II]|uniref:peptidoglycan DD-metalloendopeptidase family protein n=1 Tax=Nitratidesulfovibrio sp. HK-II TaxID=2009266 RepID=UPI000E2EEA1D|nr:peptidoglycan DD-metalloendopeptidase family protein [Nitratidesulfovibrio sp. HK-II]GBO96958.1 flagellar protein FlgJ [Nitratidesulfovibrio sp. HK-II]
MTAPVDPKLATAASAQHELTQRKLEMDALRKRLRNDPSKEQKLREACEGFESIFVQKMWEQMRATLPKEGYLHSKEEEMWQSMYDQELAKKMTSAGGIGLADMIYEQLSTRLSDASRTTAPSSVREPVPVKPVSMMPRVVTPSADGVKGGAPAKGSSMYEPASPEAPVVSDASEAHGDAPAVEGGAGGHDLVRQHLAELERQVAAAPEAATPASAATGTAALAGVPAAGVAGTGGAAGAAPASAVAAAAASGASPVAPNAPNSPTSPNLQNPVDAAGAAQAVAAPQRRASRSGKDGPTRGLPAASVAGETTRKVRSPMRDAQLGPPIVHRTGAMKRVASPAATRALTVPSGAPSAAELQSAASGSPAQGAGNAAGSAPEGPAGVTVSPPLSGGNPAAATGSPVGASPATSSPASTVSGVKSSPTGGPAVASGAPGPMAWPHEGRIASGFGWRNDPLTGERAWHPGVDIAVAEGDPVRAAWDGKVVFAGDRADYGKLVVLEHPGGWRSFYGHNGSLDVREGDTVRAGTEIAKAGGTGRVAGPHLHFEVRQGELAVNPEYAARSLASGGPSARLTRPGG